MVNNLQKTIIFRILAGLFFLFVTSGFDTFANAQKKLQEEDFYRMITIPLPEDLVLEVGGLDWLDKGKDRLVICTRRGEVWLLDNPYADPPHLPQDADASKKKNKQTEKKIDPANLVRFKRMLFGLHEPLGVLVQPDGIYLAQRSELTRIKDVDGDDRIDIVKTFCKDWEISGSYHEYAFGPKLGSKGDFWVTLNRPFGGQPEGKANWRGWAVRIDKNGKMHPVCTGLRSPAGLGANHIGDMFYTDNQGDWVAVCKLGHLKPGVYHGNPTGLATCDHPMSNVKNPGKIPNGLKMAEAAQKIANLQLPAVWFPYPHMGRSHSDIVCDETGGKFGPFAKQLFVGDQATSQIVRVYLEKVGGEYQGACFPFRRGFQCGVMRMCWGKDGSMFAGQTNRGWGSSGGKPYGLQRVVWTGKTPFEVLEMKAKSDGFELTFTQPVEPKTAKDLGSYKMQSWTYYLHNNYGCKPIDTHPLKITKVEVGRDNLSVRLIVKGLQPGYVNELRLSGVRSAEGLPLLHAEAYYTLNKIPE